MTRVHFSLASAVGSVVKIRCSFEASDVASQEEEKGDGETPCAGDCSPTLCTFLFNDDGKLSITSGEGTVLEGISSLCLDFYVARGSLVLSVMQRYDDSHFPSRRAR